MFALWESCRTPEAREALQERSQLGAGSPAADGVVVDVVGGRAGYVAVEFVTSDGRRIRADVDRYDWSTDPPIGDRPQLVYDPADPEFYVRDARLGDEPWLAVILGVASTHFLVMAVVGWRKKWPSGLPRLRRPLLSASRRAQPAPRH